MMSTPEKDDKLHTPEDLNDPRAVGSLILALKDPQIGNSLHDKMQRLS